MKQGETDLIAEIMENVKKLPRDYQQEVLDLTKALATLDQLEPATDPKAALWDKIKNSNFICR